MKNETKSGWRRRFGKWFKLGFDRSFSTGRWRQLTWLCGGLAGVFLLFWAVSWAVGSGLSGRRVVELLVDPDYGVINSISEIGAVGHRVLHGGAAFTEFNAQYPDTMDDAQYYEYEIAWFQLVLDTLRELIPSLGYLEEQSLVVQVTLGDDNYWSLNEDDFNNLDWLIIDYNF